MYSLYAEYVKLPQGKRSLGLSSRYKPREDGEAYLYPGCLSPSGLSEAMAPPLLLSSYPPLLNSFECKNTQTRSRRVLQSARPKSATCVHREKIVPIFLLVFALPRAPDNLAVSFSCRPSVLLASESYLSFLLLPAPYI